MVLENPQQANQLHPFAVRPSQPTKDQITLIQDKGILVDIVWDPSNGLRFVTRKDNSTHYSSELCGKYTPVEWLSGLCTQRSLRLPSNTNDYIDLDSLAESIRAFIHKYFDCSEQFESVSTLFVLMTWMYERFNAVPYLRFLGLPGVGKSRGLQTIGALCNRPLSISGESSSAVLFRLIEIVGGTLLLDEADYERSQVGAAIVKILNSGYQAGSPVMRTEVDRDGNYIPRAFDVFGPKIISGRKDFQDEATETRCLTYRPSPAQRPDIPRQLPQQFEAEALSIRNRCLAWRLHEFESLEPGNPEIQGLANRSAQLITPLWVIADQLTTKKFRDDLLEFGLEREEQSKGVLQSSLEALLLRAFLKHTKGLPTCFDLADRAKTDPSIRTDWKLQNSLTPRRVGTILREIGFRTRHTNKGSVAEIEPARLDALCGRYGVAMGQTPEEELAG